MVPTPIAARGSLCARCSTELPPHALACPACTALVHTERLKELASGAESAKAGGDLVRAKETWELALRFLPPDSHQHATISDRVSELTKQIEATTPPNARVSPDAPWWRRGIAGIAAVFVLLLGKLKFLLLGLTKASTLFSMFAFVGVYWSIYSWPLAVGMVLSIYIHEMGHVSMLRRLGIASGAPLFIPGLGAFVMLKQKVEDPVVDAKIGLAGPVWGLGAALAAFAVYEYTQTPIWLAIAQLSGLLNLFNLIPFWQLDGSRGMHALSREERWIVVAALGVAWYLTNMGLLVIVGAVAVWRAVQRDVGPGNRRVLATFVVLIAALSWLAKDVANHGR
jgi:Zn-dependent protease